MRSRKCLEPSILRAQLCLLAGLLILAGLLPHGAASRDNSSLAGPESTVIKVHAVGLARQPQSSDSDPPPIVTSITPDSGANNGAVRITDLSGSYFQTGATVKLTKGGQPEVLGSGVSVVSSSTITCTFDLTGVVTGTWDVVVTNPDAQSDTLTEGFTVRAPSHVYLPSVIRYWPRIALLQSIADATVVQALPDTNAGWTVDMWVGYDHCPRTLFQITRSLLKFNTSTIPSGADVIQARLYLYLVSSCDLGPRMHQVTVYRTTDPWGELSVTWSNQPGFGEAYGSAWVSSVGWGWHSYDVTDLARGWIDGSITNNGLVVRGPESSGNDSARLGFAAREWSPIEEINPYLEVIYTDDGAAAPGNILSGLATLPDAAPFGPTIRELLSPLREDSEPGMPGFVERTKDTSD